jgi:hypothetical protein
MDKHKLKICFFLFNKDSMLLLVKKIKLLAKLIIIKLIMLWEVIRKLLGGKLSLMCFKKL